MQGEFEKQVSQKMEELKLSPSAPVWQKIEMEIRPEKRRRRAIIWIPLLAAMLILMFLGSWWLFQPSDTDRRDTPLGSTVQDNNKTKTSKDNSSEKNAVPGQSESHNANIISISNTLRQQARNTAILKRVKEAEDVLRNMYSDQIQIKEDQTGSPENKKLIQNIEQARIQQQVNVATKKDSNVLTQIKEALPVVRKNAKETKWQLGFKAAIGFSGVGTDSAFLGNTLADQGNVFTPTTSMGSSGYYMPEEEKNKLGLALGIIMNRKVSNRVKLTTGIEYDLYSSKRNVGTRVNKDSVIGNRQVSGWYMNTAPPQQYTSRYHFIAVPVTVQYQLLKKAPLWIEAGISIHQLLSTNALYYDKQYQVYYQDKDHFTKTQVFANTALYYTVTSNKNFDFQFGPSLNYGLSDRDKDHNKKQHLFSLSLSTRILFNKIPLKKN